MSSSFVAETLKRLHGRQLTTIDQQYLARLAAAARRNEQEEVTRLQRQLEQARPLNVPTPPPALASPWWSDRISGQNQAASQDPILLAEISRLQQELTNAHRRQFEQELMGEYMRLQPLAGPPPGLSATVTDATPATSRPSGRREPEADRSQPIEESLPSVLGCDASSERVCRKIIKKRISSDAISDVPGSPGGGSS